MTYEPRVEPLDNGNVLISWYRLETNTRVIGFQLTVWQAMAFQERIREVATAQQFSGMPAGAAQ